MIQNSNGQSLCTKPNMVLFAFLSPCVSELVQEKKQNDYTSGGRPNSVPIPATPYLIPADV